MTAVGTSLSVLRNQTGRQSMARENDCHPADFTRRVFPLLSLVVIGNWHMVSKAAYNGGKEAARVKDVLWRDIAMTVTLHADPLPLRVDETGTIRVGASRVTLDVLLADYRKGMSPQEIVRQLDTLDLADVYAAIAYYHRHQQEIEQYLRRRTREAQALRRTVEDAQPDRAELKARLAARTIPKDSRNASPSRYWIS
jgi:uncharacterized protein (DUF433 family)